MIDTVRRALLITGCSSGIGYAVARGLRERGYRVFASARRLEDMRALASEGFDALQLDLASSASIHAAVDELLARTGGSIYGLFNNAGYGQPGAVEDLSRDALRAQFEANLFGPHELTCRILRAMRQQGYGRIIHNSSLLGYVALKYRGAYTASKHALEGLTDTLRLELEGTNVRVSLIEPGPIESRFRDNAYRAFLRCQDNPAGSAHASVYEAMTRRLNKEGPVAPFTLPARAVLKPVIHALEADRPKPRYRITLPAHLFWALWRCLPPAILDKVLLAVSRSENK
ncbi:MAG: SDR family NAD(P)-dependent oxidoreductase [Chromatiales bacterium]